MIIKYYTCDLPQTLHIFDKARAVSVILGGIDKNQQSDETGKAPIFHTLDKNINTSPFSYVSFIDDLNNPDLISYLAVYGIAYICNDDGKTIEKVSN